MAATSADEDAPTIDRTSSRNRRIEVITGRKRRRRWTAEQKREIAAESLQPEVSPMRALGSLGCPATEDFNRRFIPPDCGIPPHSAFGHPGILMLPDEGRSVRAA
jgi:hypothetical protein